MLGVTVRDKEAGAAGLFSTAVISGSSSAPNLRVMIPTAAAAANCYGGVPAIRPLETLHNALSLRQLDAFLERVTAAPVLAGTPPHATPGTSALPDTPADCTTDTTKRHSPTNSVGWSGPSSLMSSSGELPSGVSSAGPSSPTSANTDHARLPDSSYWSRNVASVVPMPQWDGEAATLCAHDAGLRALATHAHARAGSCISGDVTPVSAASDLEFNSNEATAGSGTDHDLLSAEGEDDEDTLSVDACSSPMRIIKNDLTSLSQSPASPVKVDDCEASTSKSSDLYGLSLQQTKENLYKDMPSSSKNYNNEYDVKNKCFKTENSQQWSNLNSLNLQNKDNNKPKAKINDILNNGSRRYSDSSAQRSNVSSQATGGSRFKTTLVDEEEFRASTSDSKSTDTMEQADTLAAPLVTKAKNISVKPGFSITDT
ncbi:hypothetical protein RR48_14706 [Papilio machaon]|uniref:Inositol hexakisphosphate and diphosphoinositol-pentakisphosphate kinase n=1 Tax=Papilio machaon TaxID=76193 RepID=A0A194QLL7_PAPMA|nr:hypothetical protein RR48_14706 [Papilio machaon]